VTARNQKRFEARARAARLRLDATIADAILDRLIRSAYRIELQGESLRKKQPSEPATEPQA
jgi:hypothetical protein